MIEPEDMEALMESAADPAKVVDVVVNGCAYSCCGRGWERRDGYEQTYCGYVDQLQVPDEEEAQRGAEGTFMVYSLGVGTISYVIAARFSEVLGVRLRDV